MKNLLLHVIVSGLLLQSCAPQTSNDLKSFDVVKTEVRSNVIYGSDGRLDLYQVSDDRIKRLADSTVALIENRNLILNGNLISIKGQSFQVSNNLCSSEKFKEQSTAAFCSGSLVTEDTIITAGHCIKNISDCSNTSFVFGYAVKSLNVLPTTTSPTEIYKCKSIIQRVQTAGAADYAVIKLDRKVLNHASLEIRKSGEPAVGDSLIVIGHPVGLPTKITTGGKIRSVANADYLIASVDTYGGNSGSAVFNSNTGLIEGILVRGEQDFVQSGNCTVSKVCSEDSCRGEDITRISVVRPFIPIATGGTGPVNPAPVSSKYSSMTNLAILDNSLVGIKSNLSVDKIPGSRKVFVSVDITHTYIGDLVIKVISPSGKIALIHSRAGSGTDNINKVFEVTSVLGTESQPGNYIIAVQDLAKIDTGFLNSWGIEFK